MRAVCLTALLALLCACTEDDQRYLLTYEKPTHVNVAHAAPAAVAEPSSQVAEASRVPAPAPQAPVAIAESPPPAPAPAIAATSTPQPLQTMADTASGDATAPPAEAPAETAAPTPSPPPERSAAVAEPPPRPAPPPPPPPQQQQPTIVASAAVPPPVTAPQAQPEQEAPPLFSQQRARAQAANSEAHCKQIAQQRRDDAEANDYDDDMLDQIYDGTFRNCMSWESTHP